VWADGYRDSRRPDTDALSQIGCPTIRVFRHPAVRPGTLAGGKPCGAHRGKSDLRAGGNGDEESDA